MSYPIDTTIPNAPNDPADDQPKMKDNFANINSLFSVNHFVPGATNNGKHEKVEMPVAGTKPPTGLILGEATLYGKTANSASQVFFTPDATSNEYQMTRANASNYGTFATYSTFGTVTANYAINGFWTFLPGATGGGVIQMCGIVRSTLGTPQISPSTIVVTFPFNFTNDNVIVSVVPICKSGGTTTDHVASVIDGTVSKSGFTCNYVTSTTSYVGFYWTAIGV